MPAAGRDGPARGDGAGWRRTARPPRFRLAVPVLLALAACDVRQEGVVPFTPTSDQGGGEAVVQGWLARHRPRPARPDLGADRAGAGARGLPACLPGSGAWSCDGPGQASGTPGLLAGAPRGTVFHGRVARIAGLRDRHRA